MHNTSTTDAEIKKSDPQTRKKAIKKHCASAYKPKPKEWGAGR